MSNLSETYQLNERISTLVSYIFVAVMMYCVGVAALQLGERLISGWNGGYLPVLCFLAALVAIYGRLKTRRSSELGTSVGMYRLVEVVVILVVIKLADYLWNGTGRFLTDLPMWRQNFVESFFNFEYLFSILAVFIAWTFGYLFAGNLADLEGDVLVLQSDSLEGLVSNRGAVQSQLAGKIFSIGVGMVFLTAFLRVDLSAYFGGLPPARQGVAHILVYFVIGLALLSLTQLSTRRIIWAWERIPVSQGLVNRWVTYSLIFLVIVVTLAFALPTRFTLGFLPTFSYLFAWLANIAYIFVALLIFPIILLISLLARLLGVGSGGSTPALNLQQITPRAQSGTNQVPPPWVEILKSIFFWSILIGIVGYSIYLYLNQNRELLARLRRLPGMGWLVKAWRWLVSQVRIGVEVVPKAVQAGLDRLRTLLRPDQARQEGRFLNLRRLTPHQRVLFYYYALLRRSGEVGIPREPWQTPLEYAHKIEPYIPEVETEVKTMTGEFMEARYSQHPVGVEKEGLVRTAWEHVRGVLRKRRKHNG